MPFVVYVDLANPAGPWAVPDLGEVPAVTEAAVETLLDGFCVHDLSAFGGAAAAD